MKARLLRLAGALVASAYTIYYALTYLSWHFIDMVDLIFHEAGHSIFLYFVFGEFIHVLMGSGFQVLLPLLIAGYFFYTEQALSAAVCLMWAGMSLLNVSIYAGDSIVMQLPLLGGDGSFHDWNYLLSTLGILRDTPHVAAVIYDLGILAICIAISLAFYYAWYDVPEPTRRT